MEYEDRYREDVGFDDELLGDYEGTFDDDFEDDEFGEDTEYGDLGHDFEHDELED